MFWNGMDVVTVENIRNPKQKVMLMDILVIDDNPTHANWLMELAREEGHTPFLAVSGEAARELVNTRFFDLVLLDIFLPDMKGYELMPEFVRRWPGMKIIVMTGYSSKELEVEVRRRGAIYYFIKPIDCDELTDIMQHISRKNSHNPGL